MRRSGSINLVTVSKELNDALKAKKVTRELFLEQYRIQLDTNPIYQYIKEVAEKSKEETVLLVDYQAKSEDGQRSVLGKKIKRFFSWVDYRGEWKK